MLIVVFAAARLAIVAFNPDQAVEVLAPFADERAARSVGLTADDYASACQSISGQEFSIPALQQIGLLDEDANPVEGIVVLRVA